LQAAQELGISSGPVISYQGLLLTGQTSIQDIGPVPQPASQ
jgi:hypothetical protein